MFASLIIKHINNRQKNSVHVISLHDVTAAVGKTPLCKTCENLPTQKSYSMYIVTILLNFKNILKFMNFTEF